MSEDEVLSILKIINEKLDKSSVLAQRQWQYGLGFGGMIASLALLPYSVWGAVVVFVLGYAIMVLSSRKKKA